MPSPALKRDSANNVIQESYGEQSFRGEYSGTNLIYAGFAIEGAATSIAVWQIRKLTYDGGGNITSILWPVMNGEASTDYSFIWDSRASYTYA